MNDLEFEVLAVVKSNVNIYVPLMRVNVVLSFTPQAYDTVGCAALFSYPDPSSNKLVCNNVSLDLTNQNTKYLIGTVPHTSDAVYDLFLELNDATDTLSISAYYRSITANGLPAPVIMQQRLTFKQF